MKCKEALEIENWLFAEVSEAISLDRDFTEREQKAYDAFVEVQNLRKYLEKEEISEAGKETY